MVLDCSAACLAVKICMHKPMLHSPLPRTLHCCRIVNRCSSVVQFSWRQFATAEEDFGSAAAGVSEILKQTSLGLEDPQQDMLDSLSSGILGIIFTRPCCIIITLHLAALIGVPYLFDHEWSESGTMLPAVFSLSDWHVSSVGPSLYVRGTGQRCIHMGCMTFTQLWMKVSYSRNPVMSGADEENAGISQIAAASLQRRRIEADQHLFSHTSFQLSPAQGSIWPGMEAEITVVFQPDHAKEFKATAYCEVGGRAMRLPIQLCGTGLGPKAVFSYDLLDVGEAFINTPHKYEVDLMNR